MKILLARLAVKRLSSVHKINSRYFKIRSKQISFDSYYAEMKYRLKIGSYFFVDNLEDWEL